MYVVRYKSKGCYNWRCDGHCQGHFNDSFKANSAKAKLNLAALNSVYFVRYSEGPITEGLEKCEFCGRKVSEWDLSKGN
jgi:hypothetical protein